MGSLGADACQQFFTLGDKHEFDPERWTRSADPSALPLPERAAPTGLKVLIVGAGLAGLTAALECWRNGHDVVGIIERNDGPNFSGDLIIIQPSALEFLRQWPQMRRELNDDRVDAGTYYYRHDGELIDGPSMPNFNAPAHVAERAARHPEGFAEVGPVQIRRRFFRMLLRNVARLGIRVEYGHGVERYLENVTPGLAGIVLHDGTTRSADVVIAADGIRSRSRELISGSGESGTQPSGMSVYRTAFPVELALKDESVRRRWEGRHTYEFWMGSGMHIGLYMSDEMAALGITPRDEFLDPDKSRVDRRENWDPDVDPEEVIRVMQRAMASSTDAGDASWHPVLEALVRRAPRGGLIHWPLLWRNLTGNWVSAGGRVVQIGDAAHSTVPSSAAGGTLAMEDAVTLAACLTLGHATGSSDGAALGSRVYNLLCFERASCTQKLAFVNAQTLGHTTDWDFLRKNPERARLRYPRWLFTHHPLKYVTERWSEAVEFVQGRGQSFQNTNIPPGHTFVPWTIQDIQKQIAEGKRVEDLLDGDWS